MSKTVDTDSPECPTCGRDDFANERGMKYHHSVVHGEKLPGVEVECEFCGDSFNVVPSKKDSARFCSRACQGEWRSENRSGKDHPCWKGPVELTCDNCGELFEAAPKRKDEARFCSRDCYHNWHRGENHTAWKGGLVEVTCEHCDETFKVKPYKEDDARFCSYECMGDWRSENLSGEQNPHWEGGLIPTTCEQCGGEFNARRDREHEPRFCSYDCHHAHMREDGDLQPPGYYGPNWPTQRRRARKRDDYTCRRCGTTDSEHLEANGCELHVHHIMPLRTFTDDGDTDYERANRLDNLLTLCTACHMQLEGVPVPIDTR